MIIYGILIWLIVGFVGGIIIRIHDGPMKLGYYIIFIGLGIVTLISVIFCALTEIEL